MTSAKLGKRTSEVEVTNVSSHGFWILLHDKELFLSFEDFPWFKDVPIGQLLHVKMPHAAHLYWPDLDIDIAVESIHHPKKFPLISRLQPGKSPQRSRTRTLFTARPQGARR